MSIAIEVPHTEATCLDLDTVRIDPKWAHRVPATYAIRKRVLPLCEIESVVKVACGRTPDTHTQLAMQRHVGQAIEWIIADESSLKRALERVYERVSLSGQVSLSGLAESKDSVASVVGLSDDAVTVCDELLQAAILRSASDIHLVPNESGLVVHLRVDGILEVYRELSKSLQPLVTSRLKVLAGMDIAEKRSSQDGNITTFVGSPARRIEIRVASLPTRHGERMTLRILGTNNSDLTLQSLGMSPAILRQFTSATHSPHGLILLTGPTGSGKSTTLFAAIQQLLHGRDLNVITVEDPIEYEIQGASQVEVDSADKVNFSKALRSILRHDPDVVMIGEIRDQETADTAIKSALTGHLVLSTLHTNTSAGVVTRLIDMGVQPFLVAATLRLSVAQRLIRKLCPFCQCQSTISSDYAERLGNSGLAGLRCYEPVGCVRCAGKGFAGRVGIFETLDCTSETTRLISEGANEAVIAAQSERAGAKSLLDDGIARVLDGTTTVSEVLTAVAKG